MPSKRPLPAAAGSIPRAVPATAAGADSVRRRLSTIFPPADDPKPGCSTGCAPPHPAAQRPTAVVASRRAPSDADDWQIRRSAMEILDDFDVRCQSGAREDPFEKVVAQQRAVGHAAGKRRFERVNIVDALAGVGALAEQILIHIRHRRGVGIDAACAREGTLKNRSLTTGGQ